MYNNNLQKLLNFFSVLNIIFLFDYKMWWWIDKWIIYGMKLNKRQIRKRQERFIVLRCKQNEDRTVLKMFKKF